MNVKSEQLSTGRSIDELAGEDADTWRGVDTGRVTQENGLFRRDAGRPTHAKRETMALRHSLSLYICMMRPSADGSLLAEGVGQIALAADVVDLIAGGGILRLRRGHGHSHVAGLELHRGAIVVRDGIGDVVLPAEPEVA